MRTIGAGNAAQPTGARTDFTDAVKIEVANSSDVLTNLSASAVSLEYDEGTDEIVAAATIVFRRLEGASSLAPLMTATPPVALGRRVVVSINAGSGTYKEVFRGKITDVDWPERLGDVTVQCLDQAGVAARTWIETARKYGSTTGVSLETVMQAVANDNLAAPPTLNFPAATGAVVQHIAGDPPYGPTEQSTLDSLRALAESIGWVIRWRNFDATPADWKWTVFQPTRSKVVADHTFGTSDYWDVTTIKQSDADIRNVIEVEYIGADGVRGTVTVSDSASIAEFGRLYGKITCGSDSPVNNATLATALGNAALSDLRDPDVLLEISCRYFWPGELGVDLYTFTANDKHFNTDQKLAPTGFRHRIAVGERPTTHILTRGKPSGGILMWRRKKGSLLKSGLTPGDAADIDGWIETESAHVVGLAAQGWSEEGRTRGGSGGLNIPGARIHADPLYDATGATSLIDPTNLKITTALLYPGGTGIDALRPAEAGANATETRISADTAAVGGDTAATVKDGATRARAGLVVTTGVVALAVPLVHAVANVPAISTSDGKIIDTVAVSGKPTVFPVATDDNVAALANGATVEDGATRAREGLTVTTGVVAKAVPLAHAVANVPGIDLTTGKVDKATASDTGEMLAGLRDTGRAAGTAAQGWTEEDRQRGGNGGVGDERYIGEPVRDVTGATTLLDTTAQKLSATSVDSTSSLGNPTGSLASSVTQTDGAAARALVKGRVSGSNRNGDAITFGSVFQDAPVIRLWGGILHEPRAKWGATGDGTEATAYTTTAPTYEDFGALNATASGFTVRARLRQKGTTTPRTDNFAAGNVTTVGGTKEATVVTAPALGDSYAAQYDVSVTCTPDTSDAGSASLVVAVDSSIDSGTTWVERVTQTYVVTATTGTTEDWLNEQRVIVVSGLDTTDKIRIRAKSFTKTKAAASTFTLSGDAVTYSTATGEQYASKTPDTDDRISWEAVSAT